MGAYIEVSVKHTSHRREGLQRKYPCLARDSNPDPTTPHDAVHDSTSFNFSTRPFRVNKSEVLLHKRLRGTPRKPPGTSRGPQPQFKNHCPKKQTEYSIQPLRSAATGTTNSKHFVNRRSGHIGLYARMPLRCVPLTKLTVCNGLAGSLSHVELSYGERKVPIISKALLLNCKVTLPVWRKFYWAPE
ncbi:hypothetical protein TNCV_2117421 [Trichonephila clavipes]|nr:hypothetical protein TNCV_2117421 [Trichonephila clavipes]